MFHSPLLSAPRFFARHLHISRPCLKKLKKKDPDAPKPSPRPLTPKEIELNKKRRVDKAERDERMDISMSLTEVKTYHGGFTKPRMLRASNWFPGGVYIEKGKVYEKPPDSAYAPHTVYILESRYPIHTEEPGRPDVPEHIVGMCQERDFTSLVKQKNSPNLVGSAKVSMDAAWWPFLHRHTTKDEPTKWWDKHEDPKKIRLEALGVTDDWESTPEAMRSVFPDPNQYRNNGTKIVGTTPPKTVRPPKQERTIGEIRKLYEPTLAHTPFWRPLISVTVATRPLGNTVLRLCRALPRGLPFYASIDTDDRKTHHSFPARMRILRLARIRQLTIDLARRLEGYYGGFIGIRFDSNDRGRAIRGERLAEPLPDSLRVVRVGVPKWYEYERERELWEGEAVDAGVDLEILPMDEWGRKLNIEGDVMAGQEAEEGAEIWESEEEEEEDSKESTFEEKEAEEEIEGEHNEGVIAPNQTERAAERIKPSQATSQA